MCTGFESAPFRPLIRQDHDGRHFFDIFHPLWFDFTAQTHFVGTTIPMPSNHFEFLSTASKQIKMGLEMSGANANVHAKYLWLDSQCNGHINALAATQVGPAPSNANAVSTSAAEAGKRPNRICAIIRRCFS
jgi:hypothetical protein